MSREYWFKADVDGALDWHAWDTSVEQKSCSVDYCYCIYRESLSFFPATTLQKQFLGVFWSFPSQSKSISVKVFTFVLVAFILFKGKLWSRKKGITLKCQNFLYICLKWAVALSSDYFGFGVWAWGKLYLWIEIKGNGFLYHLAFIKSILFSKVSLLVPLETLHAGKVAIVQNNLDNL